MKNLSPGIKLLIVVGIVVLLFSSTWAYSDRDKFAEDLEAQETNTAVLVEQYEELRTLFDLCVKGGEEAQRLEECRNPPVVDNPEDLIEDLPDTQVVPIPGPPGEKGEPGRPGRDGRDGAPCQPTNPFCVGPPGPIGETGAIGATGETGEVGATGATGLSCAEEFGFEACRGDPGVDGVNGVDGTDGRGIASVEIREVAPNECHLIVTYTNGDTQDAGAIDCPNPAPAPLPGG